MNEELMEIVMQLIRTGGTTATVIVCAIYGVQLAIAAMKAYVAIKLVQILANIITSQIGQKKD